MDIRQDKAAFLQHYDMAHDPFAAGGPSFQFHKPKRRVVLEELIHFSRYNRMLLVVGGPRGSGKTVLRHAMAAVTKDSMFTLVISALKSGDAAGISRELAHALGIADDDVMSLVQAIEQSSLAGRDVQLLVDDAEALDQSAILLLQRLAKGNEIARCRVFLFAEPGLVSLLQDCQQQGQEIDYHLIELEPWDETEVQEYLQQRLRSAGRDLDIFMEQELASILEQGNGWPGVINQLARDLLVARMSHQDEPVARRTAKPAQPLPYKHVAALLVIAFLFIFAWYQLDDTDTADTQEQVVDLPQEKQPARPAVAESAPAPAPAVAPPPAPAVQPKPVQQPPAPAVQPAVAPAARPAAASWYAAQPAQHYTLQVLATSSEQKARSFVSGQGSQYHYFRKQHQGQPLYVVTFGQFASRDAATAAVARLPESVRSNKPWARTFASIRQEMR